VEEMLVMEEVMEEKKREPREWKREGEKRKKFVIFFCGIL
jgi:hypothetical protein